MRPLLVLLERLWGPLGASLTALGASLGVLGRVLGALRELLETSSAQETLYFREFGPALETSTIKRASAETCTSKNGKRVTKGVNSFAWDRERAGEGIREDETRNQRNNNNALPDSFLYESLEAREQDGITAGEPESMSA